MAVFKAKFTQERKEAMVLIRYIQGRPGKDGLQLIRPLFGVDGELTREEADRLIGEAGKGMRFFHLIITPDPRLEDTRRDLRLREITQHTMQTLDDRFNQTVAWVAAEHNDHRPHRHVHIVAAMKGSLKVPDLELLRQSATHAAFLQRQQLDLTLTRDYRRALRVRSSSLKPPSAGRPLAGSVTRVSSSLRAAPNPHNPFNRHLCTCPYCLTTHDKRLETKTHRCHNCRRRLHVEPKLTLSRGKSREEAGWER